MTFNAARYTLQHMIQSFKDRETERIFNRQRSRKLPNNIQQVALRKLRMINRAMTLNDLRIPPANRLEKLKGNLKGFYSVRINKQWRLIFTWKSSHAYEIQIVDYH